MKTTMVVLTNDNDNPYVKRFFESIGPNGELLLEYTIYDAMESGFDRVVLIVTTEVKEIIKDPIERRFTGKIEIHWVDSEPLSVLSFRKRISHQYFDKNAYALWKAKNYLADPFLVVDAKCYHGKRSFERAKEFLSTNNDDFGSISLPLSEMLSPYGSVNRTVCLMKKNGVFIKSILELEKIRMMNGTINYSHPSIRIISENMPAVDMFCLNNRIFEAYKGLNETFNKSAEIPTKKITLPNLINFLVERKMTKVKVLRVHSSWFGLQFKPERILAKDTIKTMISRKHYPVDLGGTIQLI